MENKYKISTFIQIYDNRVWDARLKEFIELSKDEYNFIVQNKNNENIKMFPTRLKELKVIITDKEEKEYINYLKKITRDFQFQSLYLIATTACNLDCDYCFYRSSSSQSLKQRKNMSYEIAKKALLDFKKVVQGNIKDDNYWQQITFYGGEPLINKEMLYEAIPFTRKLFDNKTNLVINTNGVLLKQEDLKLFKDNNVELQISLDGDRDKHNLHRKTQYGELTYDTVINKIKMALDYGIDVLPMITATDDNIDNFSDLLHDIVDELKVKDFAVNVLITNSFKTKDEYCEKLATEMLKAYREFGREANDCDFESLYNKLLGQDKSISRNSCGSSRKITVFPTGNVYACQAMEKVRQNFMQTLNDNYLNNENWNCWRERSRFDNDECLSCSSVLSCGGGCATGSYNLNGSIYDIDKNNCEYTKRLFKKIHNI